LKIIRIIILYLFCSFLPGQNLFPILGGQRAGTSVFTFLKIGVSARAEGMGEAVVALHQNASSIYYNPAAIAQSSQTGISTTRVRWPADINYDYFSMVTSFDHRHFLGLSAGILHIKPMLETTEYNPHGTGKYFIFQDRFIGLTYGSKMTDRFSFGITVKYVNENLAGHTMSSTMLDMGTYYWTGFRSLRFSASLSHFGPQTKPDGTFTKRILNTDTGEEIEIESEFELFSPPTIFRVGTAMEVYESENQILTCSIQLNHPVDNAENISLGIEYSIFNSLFLRGGNKLNKDEVGYSIGMGLRRKMGKYMLTADYAYTQFQHLTPPKRLSLSLSF
jgi:hypothetical protein|tara:strand:+ start:93 stop:1094 length:1002 start_codon:yes stop_codon:yes gene_type:complete